jgi:hypothetical protein
LTGISATGREWPSRIGRPAVGKIQYGLTSAMRSRQRDLNTAREIRSQLANKMAHPGRVVKKFLDTNSMNYHEPVLRCFNSRETVKFVSFSCAIFNPAGAIN